MSRRLCMTTAACVALAFTFAIGSPSYAAKVEKQHDVLSDEVEAQMYSVLIIHGTSPAQARSLVQKIDSGALPDSMRSAKPVSRQTWMSNSRDITRMRYADGSFREIAIERPHGIVLSSPIAFASRTRFEPTSVSGCTARDTESHIVRSQCTVSEVSVTYDARFEASFAFSSDRGTITNIDNPAVNILGGSVTADPTLELVHGTSDSYRSARAYMTWGYRLAGDMAGGVAHLVLEVNDTGSQVYTE